jgi:hypothetical protein
MWLAILSLGGQRSQFLQKNSQWYGEFWGMILLIKSGEDVVDDLVTPRN